MTTTHLLYVVYDIYKPEAIYVANYIYILVAILSVFVSLVLRSFSHVSENLVLHTDKIKVQHFKLKPQETGETLIARLKLN